MIAGSRHMAAMQTSGVDQCPTRHRSLWYEARALQHTTRGKLHVAVELDDEE